MKNNLFKTLDSLNAVVDQNRLNEIIDSFNLKGDNCFTLFDLTNDRCVYFCPAITGILGHDHRKYLNKGFLFFRSIIHPKDFLYFIDEVLTLVKSADGNGEEIFPGNKAGLSIKIKHRNGDWLTSRVYLVYLKGSDRKVIKILLSFIEEDDFTGNGFPTIHANITSREKEVFRHLTFGNSAKMIADKLGISENTVITHRKNLIQKLEVRNSAELIKKGLELNILNLPSLSY